MENKTALENAGFVDGVLKTKDFRIQVDDWDNDVFEVTINTTGGKHVGFPNPVNGLEELSKVCFGFLGYDLDFTEKPKYDWETVKKELENHKSIFEDCFNSIDKISAYGWISKQEAQSMIAKLKLNIIIQQIDKDYPRDINKHNQQYGTFFVPNGYRRIEVKGVYHNCLGVPILTATIEGAQILLDQNTQLLKNLFKIETDA